MISRNHFFDVRAFQAFLFAQFNQAFLALFTPESVKPSFNVAR
jgi:hypothetical protein